MTFNPLLKNLGALLDELGIAYAIIGGQAVVQHGEPRLTVDVDAIISSDHSTVKQIVEAAPRHGFALPPFDLNEFVRKTSVLVLNEPDGPGHVDIVFGWTPYERAAIARSMKIEIDGRWIRFATPEDLILHKLFASRPRDIDDVKGILLRQRGKLDLDYLRHWLPQLAEVSDDPNLVETFEKMLSDFYRPSR